MARKLAARLGEVRGRPEDSAPGGCWGSRKASGTNLGFDMAITGFMHNEVASLGAVYHTRPKLTAARMILLLPDAKAKALGADENERCFGAAPARMGVGAAEGT